MAFEARFEIVFYRESGAEWSNLFSKREGMEGRIKILISQQM